MHGWHLNIDLDTVNPTKCGCPFALKMAACQLLLEITTFLRETFPCLPRPRTEPLVVSASAACMLTRPCPIRSLYSLPPFRLPSLGSRQLPSASGPWAWPAPVWEEDQLCRHPGRRGWPRLTQQQQPHPQVWHYLRRQEDPWGSRWAWSLSFYGKFVMFYSNGTK